MAYEYTEYFPRRSGQICKLSGGWNSSVRGFSKYIGRCGGDSKLVVNSYTLFRSPRILARPEPGSPLHRLFNFQGAGDLYSVFPVLQFGVMRFSVMFGELRSACDARSQWERRIQSRDILELWRKEPAPFSKTFREEEEKQRTKPDF